MWRKSILVNAQISRTLVDHLADDVYFHLQMAGNQMGSLVFIDRHCLNMTAPCKQRRFCNHFRLCESIEITQPRQGHFEKVQQIRAKYLLIRMTECISTDDLHNKHSSLL